MRPATGRSPTPRSAARRRSRSAEPRLRPVPAGHGGRPRAGAHRGGRPARRAGPDQPGRGDVSAGTRQLGRCRPGWPVHHRPPHRCSACSCSTSYPAGDYRQRAAALRSGAGPAIVAGVTGRRPRRLAGAAGGHGGADEGGRPSANGPPPGPRRRVRARMPPPGPRPARRPSRGPRGSPRCRPRPGTPGWCGTCPRRGPARSPWPSYHDRRRVPGATAAAAGAGRPPSARPLPGGLRLVRLHATSRATPRP